MRSSSLAELVALSGLLAVREEPDRGLVHREAGACVFAAHTRELGEPLRRAVDGRPAVDEQLVAGPRWHRDRHRDGGTRDASHPAHAQQRRGHRRTRVAGADHGLGAPLPHGLRATHERRVLLAPGRSRRVLVHAHDLARVLERDAGNAPTAGQQRLDRVLLPDEQHVDAELGDGIERAADDLARSLVATHGVDRDGDALRAHVR